MPKMTEVVSLSCSWAMTASLIECMQQNPGTERVEAQIPGADALDEGQLLGGA
jgi:hypothetical protein